MFGLFLFGEVDSIDKLIVLIKTADFGKLYTVSIICHTVSITYSPTYQNIYLPKSAVLINTINLSILPTLPNKKRPNILL